MPPVEGIANTASAAVFLWLMIGAATTFIPHPSARRDVRSRFIVLSFWAMVIAGFRAPLAPAWLVTVGLAGFVASLALFHWAGFSIRAREFSYIFSTDVPQFLHTRGPYSYVRNPFYSSYMLAFVSAALIHPGVVTIAIAVAMVFYFDMAARFEERKFEGSPLRAQYAEYKRRTGRFLPKRWSGSQLGRSGSTPVD
jgi:protein-S-isoprenylcysteine O-methyltransferase Ste14